MGKFVVINKYPGYKEARAIKESHHKYWEEWEGKIGKIKGQGAKGTVMIENIDNSKETTNLPNDDRIITFLSARDARRALLEKNTAEARAELEAATSAAEHALTRRSVYENMKRRRDAKRKLKKAEKEEKEYGEEQERLNAFQAAFKSLTNKKGKKKG